MIAILAKITSCIIYYSPVHVPVLVFLLISMTVSACRAANINHPPGWTAPNHLSGPLSHLDLSQFGGSTFPSVTNRSLHLLTHLSSRNGSASFAQLTLSNLPVV